MWAITKDIINPSCGDKPVLAHSSNWREEKRATAFPFQLRDDDGELYFEGLSTDDSSERASLRRWTSLARHMDARQSGIRREGAWEQL